MITIIIMKSNNTFQRQVILEELAKVKSHPTADEVYELARKRLPNISLGTVYRNLEWMTDNQIILKIDIAGRKKRFDYNTVKHYHMRCNKCGAVCDIEFSQLSDMEEQLNALIGVSGIEDFNIEFKGKCKNCISKK